MSIACCDPKKDRGTVDPNLMKLTAREWNTVTVSVPSLVTPAEVPNGRLFAFPVRVPSGGPAGPARYQAEKG